MCGPNGVIVIMFNEKMVFDKPDGVITYIDGMIGVTVHPDMFRWVLPSILMVEYNLDPTVFARKPDRVYWSVYTNKSISLLMSHDLTMAECTRESEQRCICDREIVNIASSTSYVDVGRR